MPRFAAIDIGSNAARLLIVQAKAPDDIRVFRSMRVASRLGHAVFQTGWLDQDSLDIAVDAMRSFAEAMDDARVTNYRAVVTASARSARNGDELISRIRDDAGLHVDLIDGMEEARIVLLAVRGEVEIEDGETLLMDLGGGSLELLAPKAEDPGTIASLPVGTVRILEAFLEDGEPVSAPVDQLIREHLRRTLEPVKDALTSRKWKNVLGTGGNFDAIAKLAPHKGDKKTIDVPAAVALLEELKAMEPRKRADRYGLRADRADVIVPALYAILAVAELTGASTIGSPGVGLKDGIARELVSRHYRVWDSAREFKDVIASAIQLGRRYHFDEGHGTRVANLATALFDDLASVHDLGKEARNDLQVAALLHDIGDFIAPSGHHKHTQYLIENSDLMGVDEERRLRIACIARFHRRALPTVRYSSFKRLSAKRREEVRRLSAILRVADALDRGHRPKVEGVAARVRDGHIELSVDAVEDPSLELWTLERKKELFEEVFQMKVSVTE